MSFFVAPCPSYPRLSVNKNRKGVKVKERKHGNRASSGGERQTARASKTSTVSKMCVLYKRVDENGLVVAIHGEYEASTSARLWLFTIRYGRWIRIWKKNFFFIHCSWIHAGGHGQTSWTLVCLVYPPMVIVAAVSLPFGALHLQLHLQLFFLFAFTWLCSASLLFLSLLPSLFLAPSSSSLFLSRSFLFFLLSLFLNYFPHCYPRLPFLLNHLLFIFPQSPYFPLRSSSSRKDTTVPEPYQHHRPSETSLHMPFLIDLPSLLSTPYLHSLPANWTALDTHHPKRRAPPNDKHNDPIYCISPGNKNNNVNLTPARDPFLSHWHRAHFPITSFFLLLVRAKR